MRWNSPPNWPPPPPGWTPPQGWQPDPAWGPPPRGHQFWVPEQAAPPTQPIPQPGAQWSAPPPGDHGKKRGLWIVAGVVVLLLLAMGGILALTLFNDDEAPAADATSEPTEEPTEEPTGELTETPTDEPTESESSEPSEEPSDTPDDLLPLGDSADVGDYVVTVDEVVLDADELVADASPLNEEPDGQYVVIGITVEYDGDSRGSAGFDLAQQFVDASGASHPSYECFATLPQPSFRLPQMSNGDSGEYQACFDVPPDQVSGGYVVVTDATDFSATGVNWASE